MDPSAFFKPFEIEVDRLGLLLEVMHALFEREKPSARRRPYRLAWRGQHDAAWPIQSALFRRLWWAAGDPEAYPDEADLAKAERTMLRETRRWGLHAGERGRLSTLSQLAMLQHYGGPTRMVDVTFNPFIALWIAVERQWRNGRRIDDTDGRLFAISVADRIINEDPALRPWEDARTIPWGSDRVMPDGLDWCSSVWAWKPPLLDHRITAQNGAFLLGGVPDAKCAKRWSDATGRSLHGDDLRRFASVALHLVRPDAPDRDRPAQPAYTLRIKAEAKPEIRRHLEQLYGYTAATVYADYPGFALHCSKDLPHRSPYEPSAEPTPAMPSNAGTSRSTPRRARSR